MEVEKKLFTMNEVASMLSCDYNFVRKLKDRNILRFMRLNKTYKTDMREIDRFIQENMGKDVSDLDNVYECPPVVDKEP